MSVKTGEVEPTKRQPKKRGRKPKGGKIVTIEEKRNILKSSENIVLHLKCSYNDLKKDNFLSEMKYNPKLESVTAFNDEEVNNFCIIQDVNTDNINIDTQVETLLDEPNTSTHTTLSKNDEVISIPNKKMIWEKIRQIKIHLSEDNISSKKSDCFWCHYSFDNPTIYIPQSKINDIYEVYGNFCSPECALAHLYSEQIDSSTKWERISLLHSLYSSIFQYTDKIKPSPNPKYLLDKYLGNMTIEEYRSMNHHKINLMILDKPITRIIPEITEYTDDIDIQARFNNKGDISNQIKYRLSRNTTVKTKAGEVLKNPTSIFTNKQYWKDIKQ